MKISTLENYPPYGIIDENMLYKSLQIPCPSLGSPALISDASLAAIRYQFFLVLIEIVSCTWTGSVYSEVQERWDEVDGYHMGSLLPLQ